MGQSYNKLQEMIVTLKLNKDQARQKIGLRLNNLQEFIAFLEGSRERYIADTVLKEQVLKWDEYREINVAKSKRILARVQQAYIAAKNVTLDLELLKSCEKIYDNIKLSCESMDQTISSIERLMLPLKTQVDSESDALNFEIIIQQAESAFQACLDKILEEIQKIEKHYDALAKMMDDVKSMVSWEMRQIEVKEKIKKTQQKVQEAQIDVQVVPQLTVKYNEDVAALDSKFCSAPSEAKQTKKDAYLAALKVWVSDNEKISTAQKIAFANYLFDKAGSHLLAEEKRWRPVTMFSVKTTSMAVAQGLLAKDLSEQDKKQLHFNEKCLDREKAQDAYLGAMGMAVPKKRWRR